MNAQHFLLGEQLQLLAVLVGYRVGVPKSFIPATQAATSQEMFHRRFILRDFTGDSNIRDSFSSLWREAITCGE